MVGCGTKATKTTSDTDSVPSQNGEVVVSKQLPDYHSDTLLVHFERGVCFGQCPVEELAIFKSGMVLFHGGKFSPKPGLHKFRLSEDGMTQLNTLLEDFDIRAYDPKFGMGVSDISTKVLAMQDENGLYKIEFKSSSDAKLNGLIGTITELIDYDAMRLIEK